MDLINPIALILTIFLVGYVVIIYELYTRINKAATAIFIAGATWLILFLANGVEQTNNHLLEYVADVSQIIFFLLAAMTLIEVMDAHRGFEPINRFLKTCSTLSRCVLQYLAISLYGEVSTSWVARR